MVIETKKVDYKLKDVKFQDGCLIDENGEVIGLIEDLMKVFGESEFTLTATFTAKTEYNVSDLSN